MPERKLTELAGRLARFRMSEGPPEGVVFTCPTCPPEHRHAIVVGWSGPSLYRSGEVWKLDSRADINALTVTPSINVDTGAEGGCRFHGSITNGIVKW